MAGSSGNPTATVAPGATETATSFCPDGMQAILGGFTVLQSPTTLRLLTDTLFVSDGGLPGWGVTMTNEGGTAQSFHVLVRCAHVS